jgi:Flp pilus assembly protein TadD
MPKIDLEKERRALDCDITYFHFKKAQKRIGKCLKAARESGDIFFLNYFQAQKEILRENFRLAIYFIDKALLQRPGDGCAYNDRALCLAELGRPAAALDWFNFGIKRDVNCVALYHNKGWLLNSLGRHGQAIVCFHKVLELDPQRPEALYSLADSYCQRGETARARAYFKKVLKLLHGKSAYMRGNTEKRIKTLEK